MQGNSLGLYPNIVTTFAGSAGSSVSTDGIGTAAGFRYPDGITTDGTNLYVTDSSAIRKIVISTGVVTTIAGIANSTGSTDGTGSAARFYSPAGITTDGTNLYVADAGNHTIRKVVISTEVVTTIAGLPGSGNYLSTDGTGSAARFFTPIGITTDGTNLYVTDSYNNKIRKIVISTGVVTTLAGSGTAGSTNGTGTAASFSDPSGITTDGTNLYVADSSIIRKIVISTGVVTTIAGTAGTAGSTDGIGSAARFSQLLYNEISFFYVTTDGTNLYVADMMNDTIRKVVISTGVVTTIAGTAGTAGSTDGTGTAARFHYLDGITTDGTNLYVADYDNYDIRKISDIATVPSSPPSNLTAIVGDGQITITWIGVSDATCYNLYCAAGTNVTEAIGTEIAFVSSPILIPDLPMA